MGSPKIVKRIRRKKVEACFKGMTYRSKFSWLGDQGTNLDSQIRNGFEADSDQA